MNAMQFLALTVMHANIIREHYDLYSLSSGSDEVSIEDLKDVISEFTGMTINVHEVPWDAHRFLGTIQRFPRHAEIYVAERGERGEPYKLTYCEQRFIAVKEMGHLLIDQPDNFAVHAADLLQDVCFPAFAELDKRPRLQSEEISVLFALETLFPFQKRKPHLERIKNGQDTALAVATHFRIPEKQVERAMNPSYVAACEGLYRLLDRPGKG